VRHVRASKNYFYLYSSARGYVEGKQDGARASDARFHSLRRNISKFCLEFEYRGERHEM
jgi:hypothetical protein